MHSPRTRKTPSSDPGPSSVRDRFLEDHQRLQRVLERLLAAFEANDRDEMALTWTDLDIGLRTHLDAEEALLLPALMRVAEDDARTILDEHEVIRNRLIELGVGVDLHIVRLDTARAFAVELAAHAHREEELLYTWGDEHLEQPVRARLFEALALGRQPRPAAARALKPAVAAP